MRLVDPDVCRVVIGLGVRRLGRHAVLDLPSAHAVLGVCSKYQLEVRAMGEVVDAHLPAGPGGLYRPGGRDGLVLVVRVVVIRDAVLDGGEHALGAVSHPGHRHVRAVLAQAPDHEATVGVAAQAHPLGQRVIGHGDPVGDGALLRVGHVDGVLEEAGVLVGRPHVALEAVDVLGDLHVGRVGVDLLGVVRVHGVVGVDAGVVDDLAPVAGLADARLVAHHELVAVVELVEVQRPLVAVDLHGGQVLDAGGSHRVPQKLEVLGQVVGYHGVAALGVSDGLAVRDGVAHDVTDLPLIAVRDLVDREDRLEQVRLHGVGGHLPRSVDEGVGGVPHVEVAVGGVLRERRAEDELVALTAHRHGGQEVAVELKADGVLGGVLVVALVDHPARAVEAAPVRSHEVARPVDVAHLRGQHVNDVERGVVVSHAAVDALLVLLEVDGVGDLVAHRDPLGPVDALHGLLARLGRLVGVGQRQELAAQREDRLRLAHAPRGAEPDSQRLEVPRGVVRGRVEVRLAQAEPVLLGVRLGEGALVAHDGCLVVVEAEPVVGRRYPALGRRPPERE